MIIRVYRCLSFSGPFSLSQNEELCYESSSDSDGLSQPCIMSMEIHLNGHNVILHYLFSRNAQLDLAFPEKSISCLGCWDRDPHRSVDHYCGRILEWGGSYFSIKIDNYLSRADMFI